MANDIEMITATLRAIHSPENRCFAKEGELLWLPAAASKELRPGRIQRQPFVGIESGKKSQFGWLLPNEPIPTTEFAKLHLKELAPGDLEATLAMLRSIASEAPGTSFAADFMWRVLPNRFHELKVHRVGLF